MKKFVTNLVLVCSLMGMGSSQYANAVVSSEQAEKLFNLAEQTLSGTFSPSGLPTLALLPDFPFYRGPYAGNVFVGIGADDSIFVVGGSFGFTPVNVGDYFDVLELLGDEAICILNNLPEELQYRQNGNAVNIITKGCIEIFQNQSFCAITKPKAPKEGEEIPNIISVLSETNLSSQVDNIEFPLDPPLNPDDPVPAEILNSLNVDNESTKTCFINADPKFVSTTIEINVCYDITLLAREFLTEGITLTSPVTNIIRSRQANTLVEDCESIKVDKIIDNSTGIIKIRQDNVDGTFNYVIPEQN